MHYFWKRKSQLTDKCQVGYSSVIGGLELANFRLKSSDFDLLTTHSSINAERIQQGNSHYLYHSDTTAGHRLNP